MKKKRQKRLFIGIMIVCVFIFVALLSAVAGVYKFNSNSPAILLLEKTMPLPALYISNSGIVSIREIKNDLKSVQKFYESQDFEQVGMRIDFGTEQGKQRLKIKEKEVINKIIENRIIESLAKERNLTVSSDEASNEIQQSADQFGGKEKLMGELARLYGWSLADFRAKVVIPELYAEKVSDAFLNEADNSSEKVRINDFYSRVTSKKEDFSKIASDNSDGNSSSSGGDLGWSNRDQLIPEISDKVFSMKPGEVSGPIESTLGFHIIKLEEKKTDGESELVHLRQIFVKKKTFGDWLEEQMGKKKVVVFLKDYKWNSQSAEVEFTSDNMIRFEKSLGSTSEGDPSVLP